MKIGAIDIGTNSMRLLIADYNDIGGGCHVLPPGEGGWFSPWGERPPLAPSKTDQKESFPASPGPPAALSPTPTGPLPIPTACWRRG